MIEVRILAGWNKVRLTTSRGADIADDATKSLRVKATKQEDDIIGKVLLAGSDGKIIDVTQLLTTKLGIALPVQVRTTTVSCPATPHRISGIGTGSAYTAGDAMGIIQKIKVPKSGVIQSATLWDFDDEGLQIDLETFKEAPAQIADNAAWSPTDESMLPFVTEIPFFSFDDQINMQTSEVNNIGKAYSAPDGYLYIQAVTKGASNIAQGAEPAFQLHILSDDPDWGG